MENIKLLLKRFKDFWPFLGLIILIIPLLVPLFKEGMFISDDGSWMIVRLSDFHRSLVDGQFPVRWAGRLNHEYGYPVFNFLYPGVLYLGEIIHLLGFNFISSVKILFGLSLILSGLFTYLWLKTLFPHWSAIVGSLIYAYAPYHIFDLYTRGSLGEIVAIATVPFILWSMERRSIFLSSLSLALLILSHNTLALLFLPIIFLYGLLSKKLNTYYLLLTALLGLVLSAFFWLPALYDQQYTVFSQIEVSKWQEFFLNAKNFYLLGWGGIFIGLFSLLILFKIREKKAFFFLGLFFISIFMTMPPANIIWQSSPLPKLVQFPWRFLSLTILASGFLGAFIISNLPRHVKVGTGVLIFVFFLISSLPLLRGIKYEVKDEGFYTTNEDTTTVQKEYMPRWVKLPPLGRPQNLAEIILGEGKLDPILQNSRRILLVTQAQTATTLKLNRIYFPGWQAKIDGVQTPISFDNPEGLMMLNLPLGKHQVEFFWGETPIRAFSDIISLIALISLITWKISKRGLKNA